MMAFDSELFNESDINEIIRTDNNLYQDKIFEGRWSDVAIPCDIGFNRQTLELVGKSVEEYVKETRDTALSDILEMHIRLDKLPKNCPAEHKLIEFFNSGAIIQTEENLLCGKNTPNIIDSLL